VNQKTTGQKHV